PDIYTLSLHDALPICIKGNAYNLSENSGKAGIDFGYASKTASRLNKLCKAIVPSRNRGLYQQLLGKIITLVRADEIHELGQLRIDRKSTRLNSSHVKI